MITLSKSKLLDLLKKEGYDGEIQEETNQIVVILKIGEHDYPTFFRIVKEGPLLQIVTFMPTSYTKETVGDTGRILHLLNKEIDLPGFCIDETSSTIFYRSVIPCLNKKLDPILLNKVLKATKLACQSFLNAIHAVASGAITFDQALKEALKSPR